MYLQDTAGIHTYTYFGHCIPIVGKIEFLVGDVKIDYQLTINTQEGATLVVPILETFIIKDREYSFSERFGFSNLYLNKENNGFDANHLPYLRRIQCFLQNIWICTDEYRISSILEDSKLKLYSNLYDLQENYPETFREVVNILRKVIPQFSELHVIKSPGNNPPFQLKFFEEHATQSLNIYRMSYNTIKLLALVMKLLYSQTDLIILDDVLDKFSTHVLVELCKLLKSIPSQIFISTQSLQLIDYYAPEHVIYVDKSYKGTVYTCMTLDSFKEHNEKFRII